MTANKDLKKRIRSRQAKTGEAYTTARLHVLRARDSKPGNQALMSDRIRAIVMKVNQRSLRIRVPDEQNSITLRTSSYEAYHATPGQFVAATLTKRWTWRGDAYATGSIERVWTDVPALGLTPLPLTDEGLCDLNEVYDPYRRPDPYAELWESFSAVPRQVWEFDGIAWGAGVGVDPEDHDACLVCDAAEISSHEPDAARELLMEALLADLRCIDAHAHLGNLLFDHSPEDALTRYEIALSIGELSLGPHFNSLLLWGHIYNRPFLRALHGSGLCLWRLGRITEAHEAFERALALNPPDNQGVRFCWAALRDGRPWSPDCSMPPSVPSSTRYAPRMAPV